MKIGIITIFHVPNYGAMLQCYSLCSYLEEKGHEVFLYDVSFSKTNRVLASLKNRVMMGFMNEFIKKRLPYFTANLSENADVYLVGSDQVWNPEIVGDKIGHYMLDFAPTGAYKIAYAASLGVSEWKYAELKDKAQRLLQDFRHISVRESSGKDLLASTFQIAATTVMDPCFLCLDFKDKFGIDVREDPQKVTTFKLVYSYDWYQKIKKTVKNMGCYWVELNGRNFKKRGDLKGLNVKKVSVHTWLQTIASSQYVVTDSFHGSVFCLIFRKQFAVVPGIKSRMTRLTSLLSQLGLGDRLVDNVEDVPKVLANKINYDEVYSKLLPLVKDSQKWLDKALPDAR